MAGEKLVKIIQNAAVGMNPETSKTDMVLGVVTSVEPLKVLIAKDDKNLELTSAFLILSPFCKAFESGTVIWDGLKKGDKVLMLRIANGNKYYVLQREEGLNVT